ncbi:hypothetical protein E2C01_043131 [Portunus trituberculatus]|uniref:Uncharacterized protein n=1 Tax=Portunus trituberculatus TaxID=210409 RepID=A0A5B7FYJ7_PORTR|nr:hypothetical protein [Portunus trituberculatus]
MVNNGTEINATGEMKLASELQYRVDVCMYKFSDYSRVSLLFILRQYEVASRAPSCRGIRCK